jgi:hypothetical protein
MNINNEQIGTIECEYKDNKIQFIFDDSYTNREDGYNIFDSFSHSIQNGLWVAEGDIYVLKELNNTILLNKENWLICLLRTEKSFIKNTKFDSHNTKFYINVEHIESEILKLGKNHLVLTDNYFLNKEMEIKCHPNHHFIFTNSIHQFNDWLSIRWYYEFKNVFEKLIPPYDIGLAVRRNNPYRNLLLIKLESLKNPKLYLSKMINLDTDKMYFDENATNNKFEHIDGMNLNSIMETDFDDLSMVNRYTINKCYFGMDLYFRILPMAKMQILSETLEYYKHDYDSIHITEKTYGLILANIPFISTNIYPIQFLQELLELEKHPFYDEMEYAKGDAILFAEFVNVFMQNFEINHILCKEWTTIAHNKFMNILNTTNSFLDDMVAGKYKNIKESIKTNLI